MEEYTMTLSKEISPGGDSSQNTHYAGPDHTVPTSINRLPALDCAVTKNPFSLSSMPTEIYSKSKPTLPTSYCINSAAMHFGPLKTAPRTCFWACLSGKYFDRTPPPAHYQFLYY